MVFQLVREYLEVLRDARLGVPKSKLAYKVNMPILLDGVVELPLQRMQVSALGPQVLGVPEFLAGQELSQHLDRWAGLLSVFLV